MKERWKELRKESEIDLKLNAHKQSEEKSDDVPFVQGISDLTSHASLSQETEAKRKRVLIGRIIVCGVRPETKWSNHEQAEVLLIKYGGPNRLMLQNYRMTCG